MFKKILIANRGEIACRIARTARDMGIATIAVYSDADRNALHVKACDEAVYLGGSEPLNSYLDTEKLLAAARLTQAEAIHPGYGFVSENAEFAEQCAAQGFVFIGPPADAIRAMGSKSAARKLMHEAGVPVLAGYDDEDQSDEILRAQAAKIGFPVLIKAVAGGGGKGLRMVEKSETFVDALAAVKRESMGAFGDDEVILEKYLVDARHIEVQIFADHQGNVVHLFERDCSLQRRHQKVLEEAPASGLSDALREEMTSAAIRCGKAVHYLGAGTVEFLVADDRFYFMEMNTRLQVEHPVTEMITGQNLVAWQLRVAAGEPLPLQQAEISCQGHAIEGRVYAENPQQNFVPSTGKLLHLQAPQSTEVIRVDTGVAQGDDISPYYDPMIAKLIVWGENRAQAMARFEQALTQYQILGVHNNLSFLMGLCAHPAVQAATANTQFIDASLEDLIQAPDGGNTNAIIMAVVFLAQSAATRTRARQQAGADPWSPWAESDGWRVGENDGQQWWLQIKTERLTAHTKRTKLGWEVQFLKCCFEVHEIASRAPELRLSINGEICHAIAIGTENQVEVLQRLQRTIFERIAPGESCAEGGIQNNDFVSPMPGKVIACQIKPGDSVAAGQIVMVVEAMKMEHSIVATLAGEVETVYFNVGDQVQEGDILLALVP